MRTAIFDLDGTLADTSPDLIAAANASLGGALLDPVRDAGTALRGGRAMLALGYARKGLDADEAATRAEADYAAFLEVYADNLHRETTLYDGVEAALDLLAAEGWRLGVCTNKPAALAETLLTALGVRGRFQAMLGADSIAVKKPDPRHLTETIARAGGARHRAVMIGDTETDLNAARAAGVPCVLVGFGPGAGGIAAMAPEAILPGYPDLPGTLARLVR